MTTDHRDAFCDVIEGWLERHKDVIKQAKSAA
jgi:hypothetical protein